MTYNDEFYMYSIASYDDDTPDVVSTLRRDFKYSINDKCIPLFLGLTTTDLTGIFFKRSASWAQGKPLVSVEERGENCLQYILGQNVFKVVRYKDSWMPNWQSHLKV